MSRGHDNERQFKRILEEEGSFVARACGSLGDADLVESRPHRNFPQAALVRVWEVKSTSGPYERFGPADRAELSAAARLAGGEAWLAWRPKGAREWKRIPESDWPKGKA